MNIANRGGLWYNVYTYYYIIKKSMSARSMRAAQYEIDGGVNEWHCSSVRRAEAR